MDISYLHDAAGKLLAVQISPELWQKLKPFAETENQAAPETPHDLEAFAEFQQAWNFPYKYDPKVKCPGCQAQTADWQADSAQPFILKNANIGGILVFHCQNCGATVRQKFFKTHMSCDHTPA